MNHLLIFSDEINSSLIDQEILNQYPNLYVIKSISKSYGVPGLRLGVLASGDKKIDFKNESGCINLEYKFVC